MCALLVVTPLNGCEGLSGVHGAHEADYWWECLGSPHIIALFRLTGTVHENTTPLTYSDYHRIACGASFGRGGADGTGVHSRGVRSGERARGERPAGLTCVCFSICVCFTLSLSFDRSVCLCGPECLFVRERGAFRCFHTLPLFEQFQTSPPRQSLVRRRTSQYLIYHVLDCVV